MIENPAMEEASYGNIPQRMKASIERSVGIPLGDAVNLALFILTIISLLLAAIGVAVAFLAYKDAHDSGDAQLKTLDQTRVSLQSARESLATMNGSIAAQQAILAKNLAVSEKQQKGLDRQIQVSQSQLKVVQAQNRREAEQQERASQTPDVSVNIDCVSAFSRESDGVTLIVSPRSYKDFVVDWTGLRGRDFGMNVQPLYITKARIVTCSFTLDNHSGAAMLDGHLMVDVQSSSIPRIGISYVDDSGTHDASRSVDALDGRTVFGNRKGQHGGHSSLDLMIPSDVKGLMIHYEYWGRNYEGESNVVGIEIKGVADPSEPLPHP